MAADDKSIYLGVWTDWSHGSVAGLTLTTTSQSGGLLIAFLALFVAFTGTCFWSIVSFTIHQMLSRQAPQNATYHQRQAILRNSGGSAAVLWKLLQMTWAWRRTNPASSIKLTLLPLAFSLISFCAFTAAGIFSSRVATSRGGEVLLVGDRCATYNSTLLTNQNYGSFQSWVASTVRSSANYESSCYTGSGSTSSCSTFARSNLSFTSKSGNPCPFPGKERICLSPDQALRLDSGFLDSHYDLGINSPPSSRFLYRSLQECAPVNAEAYTIRNTSATPKTMRIFFGNDTMNCAGQDGCSMEYDEEESLYSIYITQ